MLTVKNMASRWEMATNKETIATMDVGTRLVVFGTLDCSVPCQRDDGETGMNTV